MSEQPGADEQPSGPAIGQDEWVARPGERRASRAGWIGQVEDRLRVAPWYAWLILFVAAFSALPLVSDSGYVRRVAFDTALYMLLALGLNVVVGWGGLLDLGFVAFYGIGAYAYAMLDSDQLGVHLPTLVAIPLVVIIGAVVGFLVGLPSRRLVGDYLAIVTLFFLQIFLTLATNGNSIFGHDFTGGANGILNVDPLHLFDYDLVVQHQGIFAVSYLYVAIIVFAVVYTALHFVNHSRTGRAWRSLREDSLAAEAMGMPVNLLKLTAFSFGAGVAALTGTLFASLNGSTFPLTFSFPLLITVYTMVILGGQGSQAGVVLGAVVISVLLELLRDPGNARLIFYAFGIIAIVLAFGKSRRLAALLVGTFVFGFVVHAIVSGIDHSWVAGKEENPSSGADLLTHWVVVPTTQAGWVKPFAYIGLVAVVLLLTLLHGWVRNVVLVPTLYLAAFVWENILLPQPDVTRYIVLGALLIALMIIRPNGLLGERRVEIV
jgi:branched-chain amino acid transport system permease protein